MIRLTMSAAPPPIKSMVCSVGGLPVEPSPWHAPSNHETVHESTCLPAKGCNKYLRTKLCTTKPSAMYNTAIAKISCDTSCHLDNESPNSLIGFFDDGLISFGNVIDAMRSPVLHCQTR